MVAEKMAGLTELSCGPPKDVPQDKNTLFFFNSTSLTRRNTEKYPGKAILEVDRTKNIL